ncbi:MAG: type II secretion system protein GspM [Proteobacteria bacterium]|nr:type II secretion system protein GspM [Pseudomonadota bacterium]
MRSWFMSLEARERVFVLTAAVFSLSALGWVGIWTPLDSKHKASVEKVEAWRLSLSALRPLRGQVQALANSAPIDPASNLSLVVIVDNSLRQRGLYNSLQRSQPTPAGNGIRVEFEAAVFDDLVLWLGDLHRQYGLRVEAGSFSLASGNIPGRVNSSVTLER